MQDILVFIKNHPYLHIAFFGVVFLLILLEWMKIKRGGMKLSPTQAVQLINHQNAAVIDIRSKDAYLSGHILDAISLPLNEIETKWKKIEKLQDKPLILVCAGGLDSPKAAPLLNKHGFQPQILAGGIKAWRDAEMPLVKN